MRKILYGSLLLMSYSAFAMTLEDIGHCPHFYEINGPAESGNLPVVTGFENWNPISELKFYYAATSAPFRATLDLQALLNPLVVTDCEGAKTAINQIAEKYKAAIEDFRKGNIAGKDN